MREYCVCLLRPVARTSSVHVALDHLPPNAPSMRSCEWRVAQHVMWRTLAEREITLHESAGGTMPLSKQHAVADCPVRTWPHSARRAYCMSCVAHIIPRSLRLQRAFVFGPWGHSRCHRCRQTHPPSCSIHSSCQIPPRSPCRSRQTRGASGKCSTLACRRGEEAHARWVSASAALAFRRAPPATHARFERRLSMSSLSTTESSQCTRRRGRNCSTTVLPLPLAVGVGAGSTVSVTVTEPGGAVATVGIVEASLARETTGTADTLDIKGALHQCGGTVVRCAFARLAAGAAQRQSTHTTRVHCAGRNMGSGDATAGSEQPEMVAGAAETSKKIAMCHWLESNCWLAIGPGPSQARVRRRVLRVAWRGAFTGRPHGSTIPIAVVRSALLL